MTDFRRPCSGLPQHSRTTILDAGYINHRFDERNWP
jgi:hypothetical protein